ncbi:XdhC family protein [Microcoleus sp. FACHB-53]|nr:XdhC family protein [Microcoleus sp. FACHB-53]MBD2124819.1 XdhC family protein [Microcoleus sp. FACHB-1]
MKELQDIVAAFEKVKSGGQTAALATLVKASGSTYRRPGARMLMTSQGQMVGSLSGGCLEGDVFEQAQSVMTSGKPIVVQYDTMSEEDIIWGLGLGCNGIVQILIERVEEESPLTQILHHPPNLQTSSRFAITKTPAYQGENSKPKLPSPLSKGGLRGVNHLAFLAECLHQRQAGVLATVFHVEGQVKAEVATRLMLYPDGTLKSDIEDADLVAQIRDDAWKALNDNRSTVKAYPLLAGKAEVFIEVIQPPVPLMIFGAGHDAVPLVRLAQELGWYVTVVDNRKVETTRERFPSADEVILSRPEGISESVSLHNCTMAVVMTHNYLHDLEILKTILFSPVRYLGILGPKSRTEKLLKDLQEQGIIPTENQLQRLYSPVGLNIGADTPEEIALSIVAEIQAVLTNQSGGLLRNKLGPIHD